MQTPHDQLAKQALLEIFRTAGTVSIEQEVAPDVQKIDVWFVPNPERQAELAPFGLLAQMATAACAIEPFSTTPGLDEVRDCLGKLFAWHRLQRNEAARDRELGGAALQVPLPQLWILSRGRPESVLAALSFRSSEVHGPGVWLSDPGLGLGLVVLSELPVGRPTLALRLLGRGRTQKQALEELLALPKDAPERLRLQRIVVTLRFHLLADPSVSPDELQEMRMNLKELADRFEAEAMAKGQTLGERTAMLRSLLLLVAKRWPALHSEAESRLSPVNSSLQLEQLFEALLDTADEASARALLQAIQG